MTDKLQDSPSNLPCMSVNHVENSILDQKSLRTFLHTTLVSTTIFGEGLTMKSNMHNHNSFSSNNLQVFWQEEHTHSLLMINGTEVYLTIIDPGKREETKSVLGK